MHHRRLAVILLVAFAGCGQGKPPAPSGQGLGTMPKNIETDTQQRVDAAMAAGQAKTDEAIEAADGKLPARAEGY
ncbi:MAG: hypothetical protein HY749_08625 [Gammaproteobacteria bacterium]|nr:hypothetical protein [Gammaproteobacteria bacterium]MBI5616864.1 hypothetical protein [Gammaproteobacteria bacterium]